MLEPSEILAVLSPVDFLLQALHLLFFSPTFHPL